MKIINRPSLALLWLALLSGCGTLKINIDSSELPMSTDTETGMDFQETLNPNFTLTPTTSGSIRPVGTPTMTSNARRPTIVTPQFVAISAGEKHTCVVTNMGGVTCWGDNEHGQLGDGTLVNSNVPVEVEGMDDAQDVAAGWAHTCVLTKSGGVKCWGANANGELGNGGTTDQNRPVDVVGLSSGVIAIDAGDYHTCAVTGAHRLKCWGKNAYGQLGDWTKNNSNIPVETPFFDAGVADVSAGWGHTCVRMVEGWAKCWGNNAYGQMGFGKLTDIHLPAEYVTNLNGMVLQITADGAQTCALTAGGGVQCWGNNRYGQLGDGTNQKQDEPVQVLGLTSGVEIIEAGWNHTCAVIHDGEMMCWGWNFYGQLGIHMAGNQNAPTRVKNAQYGVKTIALGWGHTCVITKLNLVECWGLNESGQLGNGR
jgi:alpha-tubulin suppressor-like RCC1 family protein